MGLETNMQAPSPPSPLPSPSSSSVTASPSGKRSRDPEDEVYVDNLHSHKRYLSEIMASSLNCLTVGDSLPDHPMDSPARSEGIFYPRDDASLQYSPMSDDSDDARYYDTSTPTCSSQPESAPSSPVSPCRYYQRSLTGFSSGSPSTSYSPHGSAATASQLRQRASESEGRFPSSPSDICHSADLRRAALLRSVQMRAQPPGQSPFELPFSLCQESARNMDVEDRPCPQANSSVDEREYEIEDSYTLNISDTENQEKSRKMLDMNLKGDEPTDLNG